MRKLSDSEHGEPKLDQLIPEVTQRNMGRKVRALYWFLCVH